MGAANTFLRPLANPVKQTAFVAIEGDGWAEGGSRVAALFGGRAMRRLRPR